MTGTYQSPKPLSGEDGGGGLAILPELAENSGDRYVTGTYLSLGYPVIPLRPEIRRWSRQG